MHSLTIRTLLACFTLFIQCTYSSPSNDFDRNFTVAALSEITQLYTDHPLSDDDSISIEALTKVSQNVLNEFSNVTESVIDSMEFMEDQQQHIEDEDDIKYESDFEDDIIINAISSTIEEDNSSPNIDSSINNNEDITNPIYSAQYLNDNATVWELLYAQVKADITPFLILIPQPMKVYIAKTYHESIKSVKQIAQGAFSPWSSVVWKSTNQVGNFLIVLGKKLVDIAERNTEQKSQEQQRSDSISVTT